MCCLAGASRRGIPPCAWRVAACRAAATVLPSASLTLPVLPRAGPVAASACLPQALSELQKENSGLRAACVTLGRELLSFKSEFAAFQQQTVAALAVVSPGAAAMLLNGGGMGAGDAAMSPAMSPVMGAGGTDEAAQEKQQQQQRQQQQEDDSGFAVSYSSGDQAAAAAAATGPEEAQAASGAAMPLPLPLPMPAHMPASAPLVGAPAEPSMAMPKGEIVLVGGHDGGSWLDSVGEQGPGWAPGRHGLL